MKIYRQESKITSIRKAGIKILRGGLYIILCIEIIASIIWLASETGPKDFGSFYDSGRAFLLGENPYLNSYQNIFRPILGTTAIPSPNLNPPFSLYLISPFSLININLGFRIWQIISIILYVFSIILITKNFPNSRQPLLVLWAFSIAGFWHTIELGQIYILLFFLFVLTNIYFFKGQELIAGLLLGLIISIKPNFLIILIFLFVARFMKISIVGLLSSICFTIIPLIFSGPKLYLQWIEASIKYKGISFPSNSSLIGLFSYFQQPLIGYLLSAILFIFMVILLIKIKTNIHQVLNIGTISSLLFSPIAWPGYMLMLVPGILQQKWGIAHYFCAFMLSFPVILMFALLNASVISEYLWSWWYGLAFSLLLVIKVWQVIDK